MMLLTTKDTIYRLKEKFNLEFEEAFHRKEAELARISERMNRLRYVYAEIGLDDEAKKPLDDAWLPSEQPESLVLAVQDCEITVEHYFSSTQRAEAEAEARAADERRRREAADNWRERGLEEMMGGVLEVKKEDLLKKDIPKPNFVLQGKVQTQWSEDDKRIFAEYEKKVKDLNEERERFRKVMQAEIKKLTGLIEDGKMRFNEHLVSLFNKWLQIRKAVWQEELSVWRLKWSLLVDEELVTREEHLRSIRRELQQKEKEVE
ncbi:unnamed protein product [Protopolystoma xenopodis]|uniref:Uncharacterized protein n=1 Tax=Protopolystoma xenopodis TaxID=117903 RepID=A0A3S5CNW0_9PLAT|nr:unnamed protein product [Protopolystoma xenopodis]